MVLEFTITSTFCVVYINHALINQLVKIMPNPKADAFLMLEKLPDNSSFEDIQYHLYVLEKISRGITRADNEGAVSTFAAKERLGKWLAS